MSNNNDRNDNQEMRDELKALLALSVIAALILYPQIVAFSQGSPLLLPIPRWMIDVEIWDVFGTLLIFGIFVATLALRLTSEDFHWDRLKDSTRIWSKRFFGIGAVALVVGIGILILRILVGFAFKAFGWPTA